MRWSLIALVIVLSAMRGLAGSVPDPVMAAAQKRIAAYHAGEAPSGAVLRFVYFHAADREPLAQYTERMDRIMTDVSKFYRDGLERFGVKSAGIPLERKDGKLVIHLVQGRHPAAHYQHTSGDETWNEVREVLAKSMDPDREHVLVLYGLCEQAPDRRYVFTAPYYGAGWSDQRHGLCHAADCELLDTLNLTKKDTPFVFTEHYYARMEMTLAKFNSWYLGGIAHELGHGLGFPHDNGSPGEGPGVSLMGGGNLHYREEKWGGTKPAYLSRATALRFAAHPLVTQSDKGRWDASEANFEDLTADSGKGTLRITGRVKASIPPCGIIASIWPATAPTDHGAMTFCAPVADDGTFSVQITHLQAPLWHLNLGCLLVNGAETRRQLMVRCNERGEPDAAALNTDWTTEPAEQAFMRDPRLADKLLSDEAIAAAPNDEARRRLRLLRAMQDPEPEPIDLATTQDAKAFLSDARWTKAEVGWGRVVRNRYCFNKGRWEGALLNLGGQVYGKGLYAHASSEFDFPLGGSWRTFSATVGLQAGAGTLGSAVFSVVGDGKELARSKLLRAGEKEMLHVSTAGVRHLQLRAEGGEGHNRQSWAIWADPLIER